MIKNVTAESSKYNNLNIMQIKMQKENVIQKLKAQGCRITRQRMMILDIILEEECSSCKEIYYKAAEKDSSIGAATVYRLVNTLEDIGAISRKNMYKIACGDFCGIEDACVIGFDDGTQLPLSASEWNNVIREGLSSCGLLNDRKISKVEVKPCDCGR